MVTKNMPKVDCHLPLWRVFSATLSRDLTFHGKPCAKLVVLNCCPLGREYRTKFGVTPQGTKPNPRLFTWIMVFL